MAGESGRCPIERTLGSREDVLPVSRSDSFSSSSSSSSSPNNNNRSRSISGGKEAIISAARGSRPVDRRGYGSDVPPASGHQAGAHVPATRAGGGRFPPRSPFSGDGLQTRTTNPSRRPTQVLPRRRSTGSAGMPLERGYRDSGRSLGGGYAEQVDEPAVMDMRRAVRSGRVENIETALLRSSVRHELMAKNAADGAGLLMLAAAMGKVPVLERVAEEIKKRFGTTRLAKQLRYEDDDEKPLLFYAAAGKRLPMFHAVRQLVEDTIGVVGLAEQLRHQDAKGTNVLMQSCSDPEIFAEVWALLDETCWLDELCQAKDKNGKSWVIHAAEAGNLAVFHKLRVEETMALFSATDSQDWSGFQFAARGRGKFTLDFLSMLCGLCFAEPAQNSLLVEQLTRESNDDDHSTLLMHAAIGGIGCYEFVCGMMRDAGCVALLPDRQKRMCVLLSWAAQGGSIAVLNAVAGGIKADCFPDGHKYGRWYDLPNLSDKEAILLVNAIYVCAMRPTGLSLFVSAVRSGEPAMIKVVAEGLIVLVPEPKECWDLFCGVEGNPLTVAASTSVIVFKETIRALKDLAQRDTSGELIHRLTRMILPSAEITPLSRAALSENPQLFNEVLKHAQILSKETPHGSLTGGKIIRQLGHAMRIVDKEEQCCEKWISAMMLAKVLEAAKKADKDYHSGGFDVSLLNEFLGVAVEIGAFDHIRELLKSGCHPVNHFPALLSKIGINEIGTSECMILAVTAASNPFVECSIASQAIYQSTVKRQVNHAALERLQKKISELTLELLEHLPRTVSGVGEELARGDPDLEPFQAIGKVKPHELLGFVVVGWMLEGSSRSRARDDSRLQGGENSLVQAVTSGPRALELLSEALVLDYLGLKFSRTLPRWNTQKPFERNINQTFYSYTHQARRGSTDSRRPKWGLFQRLLLLLQGWDIKELSLAHRTLLPGLQFTLAGIMGKPVAFYVVPAIRMSFVVMSYLTMIGLYLSCVSLKSKRVPPNEWLFYIFELGAAWRELLEFLNAKKLEPTFGASIERYFYDRWNFLDITTVVFISLAFTFRMMELSTADGLHLFLAQFFMAASAPLLFSRVLFLAQIGRGLGPMTQVIFNMLTQLTQFSLVLLLVMLGFAASFNALYGRGTVLVEDLIDAPGTLPSAAVCDVNDHPVVLAFGSVGLALQTMFGYMLGEFSFSMFYDRYESEDGEDCGGVSYKEAGVTLMVIYLIIMAVMLLNLLIAVLSTAHTEVQRNASKEFQLARAKIILQSGDDVQDDVLPPPFNLIKPFLGIFWPVATRGSQRWDVTWEIMTGAMHRTIFAGVVGLAALAMSIALWVISLPLVALKVSQWLSEDNSDFDPPVMTRQHCMPPGSFKEEDLKIAVERIFFRDSGAQNGRVSSLYAVRLFVKLLYIMVGTVLAAVLCLVVYPVLSIVLWLRGLCSVVQYAQQMRSKNTIWERRQVERSEEEEWFIARGHAIERNRRYWTSNSSEEEFNVDALLKTTTGMTMEDLRHNMANLRSTRRKRALGASLDLVLSQFPSDDHHR